MEHFSLDEELKRERRARLAVERKLEHKQNELIEANRKLSDHALSLSGKIIDQRQVVENLEGEKTQVVEDLKTANTKVQMVERLLWDALETIKDGFALFDTDFRLITANRPYLAVLADGSIMPGDSFARILDICIEEGIVDLQGQDEDAWFAMMMDRWQAPQIEPLTLKLFDGRYIKMADRRTSDGGIVSMALNITDTIQREEELLLARDEAQAADRAKSAFLAKMSHELRTPMNGVVGMAELLLDDDLGEEGELYASTIKNSGEALLEIINDVLDFSKIEADKLELKPSPFDLERIVQDVVLIVEPSVQQKGISLSVDYDQFLPTEFVGDPGRFRQILTNLVGNAIKFTEQGHVLIRVVGLPADRPDFHQLNFTVEDTGIGIEPEMIGHVFGEFNQIEDEANRKYEGTGLGLAITKGLIEQMGGEVWVESEKGKGSCFGFGVVLPISQGHEVSSSKPSFQIGSALIVDDVILDRELLARQVSALGLNATQQPFDALATIEAREFDTVFIALDDDISPALERAELIKDATNVVLVGRAKDQKSVPPEFRFIRKPILRQALCDTLAALKPVVVPEPIAQPAAVTDLPDVEIAEPEVPEEEIASAAPRLKILAAEDNKTNQLVFKKMIKDLDIDLRLVGNGLLAVEAFKEDRPDLVFMDISMPEMDGMEATRNIRAFEAESDAPPVPIVAMTAHAMDGDEERIRAAGVDHYLTKPLKKPQIHEHIAKVAEQIGLAD